MSPRINCKVTEIDLGTLRQEVNGLLDERFAELVDLERLNLASSAASGDISMLSYNTKLKYVELSESKVSGHISTILRWQNIKLVDLSDTEVSGQPNSTWQACCKNLQDLNLARSKVKFLPPVLETGEAYDWMPKLTNLDLSGSPINGDVSALLKSFEHCASLGSIQAVACGLSGELNGKDTTSALVALNLRWNNLAHVESVPPRCKSLILAGNSRMTFSQGALQEAMQNDVFVDLQNVSFDKEEPCHNSFFSSQCKLVNVGYMFCFTDCHLMPLLHPLYAQEAAKLFNENVVQQTASRTMFGQIRMPLVMTLTPFFGELGLLQIASCRGCPRSI